MQSFRIQPYWIVLKRKCFFCDARKREKLTHTHTTTFLNAVCVVSRPLPECSLSVVSLVVFQLGSLNTLQLRLFSVVQLLLLGSKHFRRKYLPLCFFLSTATIPIYFPFLFIPPVMDLPLKKSAIFEELLISSQIRHMLLFTYASVNKQKRPYIFLFKESRHVKRSATVKTMFFFKNRPGY